MTKARSNAVANAAKGDLTVGNGTNLSGVLAVGNNGETIVADSSTSTGLRYTAGTVQSNPVINSAMQVWQRGTSFTTTGYTADRWYGSIPANFTFTRQLTNDTTNLPNIQYCMRLARNSGATTVAYPQITNSFESINSIPFVGKPITFSFYARAGANWSGASNTIFGQLVSGTGTDQNLYGGYTGSVSVAGGTVTLTTTWQRFSFTGTVGTSVTELGVQIFGLTAGTAGANDYFEVTGVQVDVGSVALPFRTYAGTIQGELAACQRYYFRFTADNNGTLINASYASTSVYAAGQLQFPVPMRTVPTSLDTNTLKWSNYAGTTYNMTSVAFNQASAFACQVYGTVSGVTAGQVGPILGQGTNSYVGLSAEL